MQHCYIAVNWASALVRSGWLGLVAVQLQQNFTEMLTHVELHWNVNMGAVFLCSLSRENCFILLELLYYFNRIFELVLLQSNRGLRRKQFQCLSHKNKLHGNLCWKALVPHGGELYIHYVSNADDFSILSQPFDH